MTRCTRFPINLACSRLYRALFIILLHGTFSSSLFTDRYMYIHSMIILSLCLKSMKGIASPIDASMSSNIKIAYVLLDLLWWVHWFCAIGIWLSYQSTAVSRYAAWIGSCIKSFSVCRIWHCRCLHIPVPYGPPSDPVLNMPNWLIGNTVGLWFVHWVPQVVWYWQVRHVRWSLIRLNKMNWLDWLF